MIRHLRILGRREQDALAAAISAPVAEWFRAWSGESTDPAVEAATLDAADEAGSIDEGLSVSRGVDSARWSRARCADPIALAARVLKAESGLSVSRSMREGIAEELARRALEDLADRVLVAGLGLEVSHGGASAAGEGVRLAPLEGAARVQVSLGSLQLELDLSGDLTRGLVPIALPAPMTRLDPIRRESTLFDEGTVGVRGSFGTLELTIDEMMRIAPGDVIVLDHALEAPVALELVGLGMACDAYLGQRDGCHALLVAGGVRALDASARGMETIVESARGAKRQGS